MRYDFPTIPWMSSFWRHAGENWWHEWVDWYDNLDSESKALYQERHPEPDTWIGFYATRHASKTGADRRSAMLGALVDAAKAGRSWKDPCKLQLIKFEIDPSEVERLAK